MLKTRVIPCLTIKDLRLVKSIQFKEHRNIGSYIAAVRVFNARDVDEMIVLDLDAAKTGIKPWLLEELTKECFMPLTIGGGIKTLQDIRTLLKLGADKVSINTAALERPEFISEAAEKFGNQCIVISIDAKKVNDHYEVFKNGGMIGVGRKPEEWAKEAEKLGAGEILITSIDEDGRMNGYDLDLVKSVTRAVKIPVIACGGAGNLDDFVKVVKEAEASAVAAGSIFQYTQTTPLNIKEYLAKFGVETRV
ncbi:MAG: glycosyl amidation-associated protein WbuZ [bacterium]|nr:glycosyl amidation-associated protein WbuZ [bacterium]